MAAARAADQNLHRIAWTHRTLARHRIQDDERAARDLCVLANDRPRRQSRQLSPRPGGHHAAPAWRHAGAEHRHDRVLPRTIRSRAMIDLRSDTVTRPTDGMRAAMAAAPVGDDEFGEDPSINELQARIAALLGKEAGLWLPSGTMANQVALRALTRPGDDVIVSRESHAVWHEMGGGGANAGVQFTEIGEGGRFTAREFVTAVKPREHMLYPPTTLVEVENTHNRAGGIGIDQAEAARIRPATHQPRITCFSDGPALWNSPPRPGQTGAEPARP